MENKEKKKTGAIIGTVVAALLCGCPGLAGICLGGLSAIGSFIPGAEINIFGSSDPNIALLWGIGVLCGGLIFIVIPIVVGILTLRKKRPAEPKPEGEPPVSNEPLPPTS
ncbi:MAG: hypothetical protein ABIJ39_10670 [Chloroflexota bacterium]